MMRVSIATYIGHSSFKDMYDMPLAIEATISFINDKLL